MVFCSDDHGQFYCLDIVITNNKKDRRENCTNGQDLREDVLDKDVGKFKSEELTHHGG